MNIIEKFNNSVYNSQCGKCCIYLIIFLKRYKLHYQMCKYYWYLVNL